MLRRTRKQKREMAQELVELGSGAHALAWQMLSHHDDAADVVQEAMVSALSPRSTYDPQKGALKPWFLQVVRNRCIDFLRRKPHLSLDADSDHIELVAPSKSNPDTQLEHQRRDAALLAALQQLSVEQREIILLRDHLDLSYHDIAQTLCVPKGTVMSRLHRAREALKSHLQEVVSHV